jgi:hypothetical protein
VAAATSVAVAEVAGANRQQGFSTRSG